MRVNIFAYCAVVLLSAALVLLAACSPKNSAAPAQYDLYLLIGQSNMAGRGALGGLEPEMPDARVFMFTKDGTWVPARDPMHFDKPAYVGVGPGLSFGKSIAAQDKNRTVGLIPAAVGGSAIAAWSAGSYHAQTKSYPYDEAIRRTRAAMKNGTLKGILWHQGESDAHADKVPLYQDALTALAENLRRDLGAPDIPFIVGGLGGFLTEKQPEAAGITAILKAAPFYIPSTGFVSANDLTHEGDGVHFDARSARELGKRYAAKYTQMRAASLAHNYKLVWADEFNEGTMPNPKKWNYRTEDGCPELCGFGNGERQWYTDARSKNARIENGKLIIEAHKEEMGTQQYTSARLNTRYKGDWLYGRFEVRAKMPSGRGTWPAIWMMPTDMKYGEWPNSGEIDIMEHVGHEPDEISGTVHTKTFNHMIGTHKGVHHPFLGSQDNFHTYGINWTPEKIEFFVDDDIYFTFENTGKGYADYPFDQRFYMILNIAVGGNLGGAKGVDPSAFPTRMEVDFVRVYQSK